MIEDLRSKIAHIYSRIGRNVRVLLVAVAVVSTFNFQTPIVPVAFAQSTNTLTSPDTTSNPNTTGFKLVSCDGPDLSGLTTSINVTVNGQSVATAPGSNPSGYVPCNFNGVMIQIQHLINVALVVGVFAAIAAFSYAGFLYVSGKESNISKAHEIFPKIFFGFVIMLSAWFLVYQILSWLTGNGNAFTALLGNP